MDRFYAAGGVRPSPGRIGRADPGRRLNIARMPGKGRAHNGADPERSHAMRLPVPPPAILLATLALAACATTPGQADAPPVDLTGAEVAARTLDNGDVVEEYRVGTQLRMVKITPVRGAPYYLYDRDGDGALDRDDAERLPQTYWKLFSW